MKSLISQFLHSFNQSFSGRTSIILAGSVAGQAIVFILLPLTTQIYDANALGRAASTLAFLSIVVLFIFLQYDQSLIVAEDEDLPYLLLLSGLLYAIWIAGLVTILLVSWLFLQPAYSFLHSIGVNTVLILLIATYSPFLLFTNYHLRRNALVKVSLGRIIYYGGGASLQVAGGAVFGGKEHVFLLAQVAAAAIASVYIIPWKSVATWLQANKIEIAHIYSNIVRIVRLYIKFPKYQAPAQFVNAVSVNMPVIFMRIAFSDTWAGWYFIAWRILAAPTTLLSQAVGQVFYRDSAENERIGLSQGRRIESMVYGLVRISLLPAVALVLLSPFLVTLLFGSEWLPVADILQILVIAFTVAFFVSPVSNLLNVKDKQERILFYYVLLFLSRLLALGIGWWLGSGMASVWLYSLASVAVLLPFVVDVIHNMEGNVKPIIYKLKNSLLNVTVVLIVGIAVAVLDATTYLSGLVALILVILSAVWIEIRYIQPNFLKPVRISR
jgi:O-antigen/teichoic acid export membrane protein